MNDSSLKEKVTVINALRNQHAKGILEVKNTINKAGMEVKVTDLKMELGKATEKEVNRAENIVNSVFNPKKVRLN